METIVHPPSPKLGLVCLRCDKKFPSRPVRKYCDVCGYKGQVRRVERPFKGAEAAGPPETPVVRARQVRKQTVLAQPLAPASTSVKQAAKPKPKPKTRAEKIEIEIDKKVDESMRGARPKPLDIHLQNGDPSHKGRATMKQQLESPVLNPSTGYGPPPEDLNETGRDLWTMLTAELTLMKQNKKPDFGALHGACRCYGEAVRADRLVDLHGMLIESKRFNEDTGELEVMDLKPNPAVSISLKYWALYARFCAEFGLTPVSRTRLANHSDGGESQKAMAEELQAILSRPRQRGPSVAVQVVVPAQSTIETSGNGSSTVKVITQTQMQPQQAVEVGVEDNE